MVGMGVSFSRVSLLFLFCIVPTERNTPEFDSSGNFVLLSHVTRITQSTILPLNHFDQIILSSPKFTFTFPST